MSAEAEVQDPVAAYKEMAALWELPIDLLGGTRAMRDANFKWLPKEPGESVDAYNVRLSRSFLFNGFKETINQLTEKVFRRPAVIQDTTPGQLMDLAGNVDLSGQDLTSFSRGVFGDGIAMGLSHILVDFPFDENADTRSRGEERANGMRPFFIHIPASAVIGWRSTRVLGTEVLTQLRYREMSVEPVGEWGEDIRERIRVWTPSIIQIYEKDNKGKFELLPGTEGTRPNTLGVIPLATFYTDRQDFMIARPPLESLAFTNLAHWQSYSDQRNVLRFARTGILFGAGFSQAEVGKTVELGANRMLRSTNEKANMKWVEHTGAAIGAGRQDLIDLEDKMVIEGLQPLLSRRPGRETATARVLHSAETDSSLASWVRSYENTVEQAMIYAGAWMGVEEEGIQVDINDEFGMNLRSAEELDRIIKARLAGEISRPTFWRELKRRGVLSDAFDPEEEQRLLDQEGPALGELMGGGPPQPTPES